MFPIVSKKRRVDEETGQVVEGKTLNCCIDPYSNTFSFQIGTWYSRTMSGNRTRPHSNSCKWPTHGPKPRSQVRPCNHQHSYQDWDLLQLQQGRLLKRQPRSTETTTPAVLPAQTAKIEPVLWKRSFSSRGLSVYLPSGVFSLYLCV